MFLKQQLWILELFLKDHVTLKTAVMAFDNSTFPSQEYIYINCNNISQYNFFLQNFWSKKCSLCEHKRLLKKQQHKVHYQLVFNLNESVRSPDAGCEQQYSTNKSHCRQLLQSIPQHTISKHINQTTSRHTAPPASFPSLCFECKYGTGFGAFKTDTPSKVVTEIQWWAKLISLALPLVEVSKPLISSINNGTLWII